MRAAAGRRGPRRFRWPFHSATGLTIKWRQLLTPGSYDYRAAVQVHQRLPSFRGRQKNNSNNNNNNKNTTLQLRVGFSISSSFYFVLPFFQYRVFFSFPSVVFLNAEVNALQLMASLSVSSAHTQVHTHTHTHGPATRLLGCFFFSLTTGIIKIMFRRSPKERTPCRNATSF